MDYYGTSLHKWLLAPTGTGFLYVRKDRIAKTWPMQAAPERSDNDIRKFEAIGTHPWAIRAALDGYQPREKPSLEAIYFWKQSNRLSLGMRGQVQYIQTFNGSRDLPIKSLSSPQTSSM